MKRVLIITTLLIVGVSATLAQNETMNRSIRIGYSYIGGAVRDAYPIYEDVSVYSGNSFSIDMDIMKMSQNTTLGAHLEFGGSAISEHDEMFAILTPTIGIHYGIDVSFHVLRRIDPANNRWDVRLNGTLGSYWCPNLTPQVEYGAGISVFYYPFKHIGVFGELQWGHYHYNEWAWHMVGFGNSKMKAGVSYRF